MYISHRWVHFKVHFHRWVHITVHFSQVGAHYGTFFTGGCTFMYISHRGVHIYVHFSQVGAHLCTILTGAGAHDIFARVHALVNLSTYVFFRPFALIVTSE